MFSSKEILTNNVTLNNDINLIKNNVKTNNVNHKRVEVLANDLADKLNSPNSYKLFCKVIYKNPEPVIQRCLGLTLEADNVFNKGGYFISLIKIYGNL